MEFLYGLISMPIPLWGVLVIISIVFLIGVVTFNFALKGFIPALQRASEIVIKNNQKALDTYFLNTDQQIQELNNTLNSLGGQYQSDIKKGHKDVAKLNTDITEIISALKSSIETMQQRMNTISALEAEIIKMKNIIKRR